MYFQIEACGRFSWAFATTSVSHADRFIGMILLHCGRVVVLWCYIAAGFSLIACGRLRPALEPRNDGQKSPALRSFAGVPLEYVIWITSAVETALGTGTLGACTCKCGSQDGDYGFRAERRQVPGSGP